MTLPDGLMPSCTNTMVLAATSAAMTHALSLDLLFIRLGAPPAIHWALAGVAADQYCKGRLTADEQTGYSAIAGYAGGYAMAMLLRPR